MSLTVLMNAGPWLSVPPPRLRRHRERDRHPGAGAAPAGRAGGARHGRHQHACRWTSSWPSSATGSSRRCSGRTTRSAGSCRRTWHGVARRAARPRRHRPGARPRGGGRPGHARRDGPGRPAGAAHPALGPGQAPRALRHVRRRQPGTGQRRVRVAAGARPAGAAGTLASVTCTSPPRWPSDADRRPTRDEGRPRRHPGPDQPGQGAGPGAPGWPTAPASPWCWPARSGPYHRPADLAAADDEAAAEPGRAVLPRPRRPARRRRPGALGRHRRRPGPRRPASAGARASLFPLRWEEPGGTAVVESLALGTPVVGTARGCLPELIEHGRTGLLTDDEEELGDLVLAADRLDPDECRREAAAAVHPGGDGAALPRALRAGPALASAAAPAAGRLTAGGPVLPSPGPGTFRFCQQRERDRAARTETRRRWPAGSPARYATSQP